MEVISTSFDLPTSGSMMMITSSRFSCDNSNSSDLSLMQEIPAKDLTHFRRMTQREVVKEDNAFIRKTMQMDPRDRPSARELLQDEWFYEDGLVGRH